MRGRRITAVLLALAIIIGLVQLSEVRVEAAAAKPNLTYQAHVRNKGWMSTVSAPNTAGTTGKSLQLEALKINLKYNGKNAVKYRVHSADIGWGDWKNSGGVAGTTGKSKRAEAVQIKLTGDITKSYDIYYRVHVAGSGWLAWTSNGKTAGSTGSSLRMEAIQIKLVKKNSKVSGSDGISNITKTTLKVQPHVQDIGWMNYVGEGATAGTTGKSKRLEALKITLKDFNGGNGISYRAHVANVGWQSWKNSGQMAGTTGKGYAIEAVQIKLTGEIAKHYNVYYRMHVANYGWLGWAANGEKAGTEGCGIRAEAIEIKLVAKGVEFNKGAKAYYDSSTIKKAGGASGKASISYNYSSGVSVGTIRYIKQISGSAYYDSRYWGKWPSGSECGTASISMALSYIGVNQTPKDILDAGKGLTYFGRNWGGSQFKSPDIQTAISNYLNGNGRYSPPIIHLSNYSSRGHYVIIAGKVSDNVYQIVDPANHNSWNMTINGNMATYYAGSERLISVYQYYK